MTTLLDTLSVKFPDSSKTTLRSWLKEGRISVNGAIASSAQMVVQDADKIELGVKNKYLPKDITILYEDRDLIIIVKPEGLLTVATEKDLFNNAHNVLKRKYYKQEVYPVHRLDREASGVLVFAYTEEARDNLKQQFEEHSIYREYHAIVEGKITPLEGTWKNYLEEDAFLYVKEAKGAGMGKLAISHYKVLAQTDKFSYLKVNLETGRKNQIRVHCQIASHSIVGDEKYGSTKNPIHRLGLHARVLSFVHPRTKKKMEFISPPPVSFTSLFPKGIGK